jgi:hypothetical protein
MPGAATILPTGLCGTLQHAAAPARMTFGTRTASVPEQHPGKNDFQNGQCFGARAAPRQECQSCTLARMPELHLGKNDFGNGDCLGARAAPTTVRIISADI